MAHDIVSYGYDKNGDFYHHFGDVIVQRDHSRAFELLDKLQHFFGFVIREKRIEVTQYGGADVTVTFTADSWYEHEDKAEDLERMLKWLVLKLSVEELKYLGVLPGVDARDPSTYSVEELMAGLREQFDEFKRADDRLRASIRGNDRGSR